MKLTARFIQTDDRTHGIVGTLIHVEDVFHRANKVGILGRRDAPSISLTRA